MSEYRRYRDTESLECVHVNAEAYVELFSALAACFVSDVTQSLSPNAVGELFTSRSDPKIPVM